MQISIGIIQYRWINILEFEWASMGKDSVSSQVALFLEVDPKNTSVEKEWAYSIDK